MDNKRPIIQHLHGPGIPADATLAPFEIGIGYETVETTNESGNTETTQKITLYTSTDGINILPISNSGTDYEIADEQYF